MKIENDVRDDDWRGGFQGCWYTDGDTKDTDEHKGEDDKKQKGHYSLGHRL